MFWRRGRGNNTFFVKGGGEVPDEVFSFEKSPLLADAEPFGGAEKAYIPLMVCKDVLQRRS